MNDYEPLYTLDGDSILEILEDWSGHGPAVVTRPKGGGPEGMGAFIYLSARHDAGDRPKPAVSHFSLIP